MIWIIILAIFILLLLRNFFNRFHNGKIFYSYGYLTYPFFYIYLIIILHFSHKINTFRVFFLNPLQYFLAWERVLFLRSKAFGKPLKAVKMREHLLQRQWEGLNGFKNKTFRERILIFFKIQDQRLHPWS